MKHQDIYEGLDEFAEDNQELIKSRRNFLKFLEGTNSTITIPYFLTKDIRLKKDIILLVSKMIAIIEQDLDEALEEINLKILEKE